MATAGNAKQQNELVISAYEVSAGLLDLGDHILEILLLRCLQLFIVSDVLDVEFMLCLGLRRLKRAGKDGDLCIARLLRHLRVTKILV